MLKITKTSFWNFASAEYVRNFKKINNWFKKIFSKFSKDFYLPHMEFEGSIGLAMRKMNYFFSHIFIF
jgi:hypothetical protein